MHYDPATSQNQLLTIYFPTKQLLLFDTTVAYHQGYINV